MSAKKIYPKIVSFKHVAVYIAYLLVFWGFYRFLFQLPEQIEETVVKPIAWLLPVLYFIRQEKQNISSLGLTWRNFFPAVYFALGLGAIFVIEAVLVNFIKYGAITPNLNFGDKTLLVSLGISFATAFSEEISFRGYIFQRLWKTLGKEWLANIVTTFFWVVIHIPVTIFIWKLSLPDALVYLFITGVYGIGSAFIFARTKNIFSPILLHVLWEWPIILFK